MQNARTRLIADAVAISTHAGAVLLIVNRDALKQFPLDGSAQEADGKDGDGSSDDTEPGCCVLCERLMPLTRHHVIPRYTPGID